LKNKSFNNNNNNNYSLSKCFNPESSSKPGKLRIKVKDDILVLLHEEVGPVTDVEVCEDEAHLDEGQKKSFNIVDLLNGLFKKKTCKPFRQIL
jgi:hypothetical protein